MRPDLVNHRAFAVIGRQICGSGRSSHQYTGRIFWLHCFCRHKREKGESQKSVRSIASLCLALTLCFIGIYAVGNNKKPLPDGLSAVESNIVEIHVYSHGEQRSVDVDSYIYRTFASQIANCGGHLLEIQKPSESGVWNDSDCFIEIIYASAQTIRFENAEDFSIENADRLLYIAGQNILYWGDSGYQNCLDYTKTDGELQAHKEEILMEYRELLRSFVIASTSSNSAVLPAGGFP